MMDGSQEIMEFLVDLYHKFTQALLGAISNENDMAINEYESDEECSFNCLPDEIVTKIFSYFSLEELCWTVRFVCHRWLNISYASILWCRLTTEDIKSLTGNRVISALGLIQLLRMHSASLKYLCLENCYDIAEEDLLIVADLVPHLCELSLTFCTQVNQTILKRFAVNCPALSALCLEGCDEITEDCLLLFAAHRIHKLNLSHCNNLTNGSLLFVARTFRDLTALNIDGVQWITDDAVSMLLLNCQCSLQNLWLDGENLTDYALTRLVNCHKLRTLKISFCQQLTDQTLSYITYIRNLKSLYLKKGKQFSNDGVISMFDDLCTGLYHLEITDCQAFNDLAVLHLVKSSPDLITLNLAWCWDITDEGLEYILCYCQRMEHLTLIGLHVLSGEPLRDVVLRLPRLKYLDLSNCNNIQDSIIRQAVDEKPALKILDYYGSVVE